MRTLLRFAQQRWIRSFIGAVILAVLVWIFGPLLGVGSLHPLDSELVRYIVIAAIFVLWLVFNLVQELRVRRKEKELVDGVAAAAPDPDATASAEEVAALSERLKEAVAALKKARIGGRSSRYLYQLPWYMFIGPPGAGKTTALVNCGLNFPLADTHGPKAVQGVGGTRNCDWWFTDQAVLIDTAGRYTTQDSNTAVDSAAWLGFLKLLKKTRSRQPLNGVLVAVSLADLASLGDAERLAHAKAIRRRIRELHDELGMRIPAYVMFTKADLLAGFVEFFDNLGKEDREQVWGMTFPLDDGKDENGTVVGFGPEFDALLARLNDRMLERVQQEGDLPRRRLVYGFPQQLASLRTVATEFLTEVFRPSRLEARPLLRGVYFTSGTQDGTPIDRLLGAMAGQFGLQRQAVTAFSGAGRSYFLARLMREVLFGEAGLVSRDPKVERRQRWTQIAAYSAAAVVLLLLTGAWTASYIGNRNMISAVHAAGMHYVTDYATLAKRGSQDVDLAATLPSLATLRDMPGGYAARESETPLQLTFGLYQGQKLSSAANDAYGRALNAILLPRLLARLEAQMQSHLNKPEFLYQALKVYLILGRQGPLDRDLVEQWLGADIAANYAGDDNAEQREALQAHLHALLQYPLATMPLNGPLVAEARRVLDRPLSEYVYDRMLHSKSVQALPDWTVAENAGPAGSRVFELRDGKPLTTGMPGIFTWNGYHTVFQALLPGVTKDATEDAWVLGRQTKGGLATMVGRIAQLRRDVLGLYLDDYTRHWDAMLANIGLKRFTNVTQGLDELYLLSAPELPLRDLWQAVAVQTQLSRPAAVEQAAGQAEAKLAKVGEKASRFASYAVHAGMSTEEAEIGEILSEAFGTNAATGKPVDPASRVDDHFRSLNEFVTGSKDKPAQLEVVIGKIQQIYQGMNQAANSPNQGQALLSQIGGGAGAAAGAGSATAQLQDIAQSVPKPVAAMLQTVSQSSSQATASGASQQLADAWTTEVYPLCQDAFNRYPFIKDSKEDVPPLDFKNLLGPGGKFDQFFDHYLKTLVNTSKKPWTWQAVEHSKLDVSAELLPEFELARDIRDAFFPDGGSKISVGFSLQPEQIDAGLAKISIEIGAQRKEFIHGPPERVDLQWPAPDGSTLVRVTMTPVSGNETRIEEDGAWALLRLLDVAHVTRSGQSDKLRIAFTGPAGGAEFVLTANSVHNPFTLPALGKFRCPAKL